jgi:hypothetical protein
LFVGIESSERPGDEVVEVEAAFGRQGGLVGNERSGDRPGFGIGGGLG